MSDGVEIRALRAGDDLDAQLDLSVRAFGPRSSEDKQSWRQLTELAIANGTCQAAFDAGRPAGAALFFDMRQWWHGRAVPMAGVSGVKVAPEDRGRGIGRRLMSTLLEDIADRGFPLSVLYPATTPLYRSLGWELAGMLYTAEVPARSLRSLTPPDAALPASTVPASTLPASTAIRRAVPGDGLAINDIIGRAHEAALDCGPMTWEEAVNEMEIADDTTFTYLCDDGYTSYEWYDGRKGIFAGGVQAVTGQAARALWTLIASNTSIAEKVKFCTHPGDPIWQLTVEQDIEVRSTWSWMLRVVDAPAAIAARGFPAAVRIDVPVRIVDQHRPANTGHWMLSVADGKGSLQRASDSAAFRVGARGFAALYAGKPVSTLRAAGLADGDPAHDAVLDAAFSATPYLLDSF